MKKGLINTSLYYARIKKGVSIKEAAKALKITSLKLSLIEHGYLNVGKRKYDNFINYYKLPENFFKTHSTYVEPYEKDTINFEKLRNKARKLEKKKVRIFAYISIFTSACCVAFGLYANNRRFLTPRIAWTKDFAQFTDVVKKKGDRVESKIAGDYIYTFSSPEVIPAELGIHEVQSNAVTVYEKDTNSENTNIDSTIRRVERINDKDIKTLQESNFYLFGSNKKKVIYFSYRDYVKDLKILSATVIVSGEYPNFVFKLRPFICYDKGVMSKIQEGSPLYNQIDDILQSEVIKAYINIDKFLIVNDLVYSSASDLLSDIQKISRDSTLFARLGISFISVFSFTGCIFLVLLFLSYYSKHQLASKPPKLSKETKQILNYEYSTNEKYDDIRYPSFVPEFGTRSLGLIILFISSFALFISVYLIFNGNFIGFADFKPFRDISTNFLSSAVLLLFFIKLDVYSRKNANQLLTNIITLFVAGLVFYIVEVLLFNAILKDENIFSTILLIIKDIIPGNVIWNIMLYSLIFYFLFTTPRKYLNDATKVIKWRLCSLIPTFILIFALFYKFFFEPRLPTSAIYVSLMFHTSGIITTLFAIIYLYSLYFLNLINKFNYGVKDAEVFSYSRRYSLYKNSIACIIIALLFLIDTFFRYNIPDNNLKLGKNWAIILLIPIIMFYRPHIGKRNATWDNIYTFLYGTFFAGGYLSVAIYILLKLDIAELLYIRF